MIGKLRRGLRLYGRSKKAKKIVSSVLEHKKEYKLLFSGARGWLRKQSMTRQKR